MNDEYKQPIYHSPQPHPHQHQQYGQHQHQHQHQYKNGTGSQQGIGGGYGASINDMAYKTSNTATYQYLHQNGMNNNNLPIIVPKSTSSDDTNYTLTHNYPTPSITPHSSNAMTGPYHPRYNNNNTNNNGLLHSNHSNNTSNNPNGNASNLLPTIKYYQYSNFSNNSNSTQISSATNQSNGTSIHSGFSDPHYNVASYHSDHGHMTIPQQPQQPQHQHQHHQQQQTQSTISMYGGYQQIPNHLQQHQQQLSSMNNIMSLNDPSSLSQMNGQILPRSSTGNINLLDLDIEIEDDNNNNNNNNNNDDKKETPTISNVPSVHSHHSMSNTTHQSDINKTRKKHERTTTRQLELKSFHDDIRAYNTWISCLNQNENNIIYFYVLYPKLCEYFVDIVNSTRLPTVNDLRPIFIKHGALITGQYLTIAKANFIKFWSWFKECCEIIKELRYLWDPKGGDILDVPSSAASSSSSSSSSSCSTHSNDHKIDKKGDKDKNMIGGLGLNFFCQRQVCEANLLQSIDGTFGLRLSSSIIGGVVLSYVENNYNDINNKRGCKHVILIRQQNQNNMYLCNKKILSLHDIIRNFVKLKFLYTPNRAIPKEKIF